MTKLCLALLAAVTLAWSVPLSAQSVEPPRAQFDRLSNSLADVSEDYVGDTMKTISFLLLAMGWLITSKESRRHLGKNPTAYRAALIAVPAVAVLHLVLTLQVFAASQSKMAALARLHYLGPDFYADDEITLVLLLANLAIHLVLFGTLFALVMACKGSAGGGESQ